MAAWALADRPPVLFDPAVGPGTFFAAARSIGFQGRFAGFEVDHAAMARAGQLGIGPAELEGVVLHDFLSSRIKTTFPAIISNPPYIRHHRLTAGQKRELRDQAGRWLGFTLDGRMGLHVYFLLKCLEILSPGGRLAFLLPADVCEGVSSEPMWRRLAARYRLDAVITFAVEATPFPGVDTNALVILMSNRPPCQQVPWLRVLRPEMEEILGWLERMGARLHHPGGMKEGSRGAKQGEPPGTAVKADCIPEGCQNTASDTDAWLSSTPPGCGGITHVHRGSPVSGDPRLPSASPPGWKGLLKPGKPSEFPAIERDLDELLTTGLSRHPRVGSAPGVPLSAFARVTRGIATGANDFFFLTSGQMRSLGSKGQFFQRAIGRTRDCRGDVLTLADLAALDRAGRPTWLLALDATPERKLPVALRKYLRTGREMKLPARPLLATRRPWYRMEHRAAPALLFAYLGRRDCRFILNEAGAVPLTGFLCVYPRNDSEKDIRRLWRALNHPATLAGLAYVGKSYGGGAIKVEPRQLDRLLIPEFVIEQYKLGVPDGREIK